MQSIFKEEIVFVKIPPNKAVKKCHAFTYRKIQASSQPVKFVVINDPIRNFANFAQKVMYPYIHNTPSQMHVETRLLKNKTNSTHITDEISTHFLNYKFKRRHIFNRDFGSEKFIYSFKTFNHIRPKTTDLT